jgi:predicted anti-sigma-YlaC factor YlaD
MRMCGDKKIRSEIFSYIDGTLDAQTAEKVAEHLKGCPDCRKLEQEYRRTIGGLKKVFKVSALEHISNEALVEYADGPENVEEDVRKNMELHLAVCRSCERKAELLQRVRSEQESRQSNIIRNWLPAVGNDIRRMFGRRTTATISAAAVLILAFAVVYWIFVGTNRGPEVRFVSTHGIDWLNESLRGDQPLPEIHEEDDWIRVGVKFPAFFKQEAYTIQLQTNEGRALRQLAVREEDYKETGIGLAIKTANLPPGKYRLLLISRRLSDEAYSLQVAYPFILLKAGT